MNHVSHINRAVCALAAILLCASCGDDEEPKTLSSKPLQSSDGNTASYTANMTNDGKVTGGNAHWNPVFVVPQFPKSDVAEMYAIDAGPGMGSGCARLETDESPRAVQAFYDKWCDSNGWQVAPSWKLESETDSFCSTVRWKGRFKARIIATTNKPDNDDRYKNRRNTVIVISIEDRKTDAPPPDLSAESKLVRELSGSSPQDAIAKYTALLKDYPYAADMWFERGNAWFHAGNLEKALADYKKASQLAPDDTAYAEAVRDIKSKLNR